MNEFFSNPSIFWPSVISAGSLMVSIWSYVNAKKESFVSQYSLRFNMYSKILDYCLFFIYHEINDVEIGKLRKKAVNGFRESQFLFPTESGVYEKIKEIIQLTGVIEHYYKEKKRYNHADLEVNALLGQLEELLIPYMSFNKVTQPQVKELRSSQSLS
ncbi:hypothetical protein ACD661_16430 [Legionella lytica]|uniref:DUF4760 domain-containing protein n=1 Tax=Legionella lytica TaxID=96232 RepID=A0ABW8DE82_9GAMM